MATITMTTIKGTIMSTDTVALYRLLTWLSPAYPVGAFSYSQGLETAVATGRVGNAAQTREWICDALQAGMVWSDAVIFVQAYRPAAASDWPALQTINEFAHAFVPSAELRLETLAQGDAFAATTGGAWHCEPIEMLARHKGPGTAYQVAVDAAAAGHRVDLAPALEAWIHAACASLISAATRLVPLGQTEGQVIMAQLEPAVRDTAERALATPLEALATCGLAAEICSMNHEIQHTRLFRS
jgi:urease accessory protein